MNRSGPLVCKLIRYGIVVAAVNLTGGVAAAADFWLCAGVTTKTMPDTDEVVSMWGFALDDDADLGNGCGSPPQVPGPALRVPVGDDTLNIHLRNDLGQPVSLVIKGQRAVMTPVMIPDAQGRQRMQSLTHETAAGSTGLYSWSGLRPGTFLYQSGTRSAVQVQMGLYGSLVKDAAPATAYTGLGYDQEVLLLYSEIDPALHSAVMDGSYGTPAYPSTIDYRPTYFLINGEPHSAGSSALDNVQVGESVLLRLLNAGLRSHVPTFPSHVRVVAEDGHPYPYAREQYSLLLAAGQTRDAIFTPASAGSYAIYDSLFALTNGGNAQGGMLAFLDVSAAPGAPVAMDDSYDVVEDGSLIVPAPGVLANDSGSAALTATLVGAVTSGDLSLNADGSFSYTPLANYSGGASFDYVANDGVQDSTVARVNIEVTPVNDAPVAQGDDYQVNQDAVLSVPAPGVLANDTDVDGDVLQALLQTATSQGSLSLAADGSFTYTPNADYSGPDSFSYIADDGNGGESGITTVNITVDAVANIAPVAVDDYTTTVRTRSVRINLVANDTDADGSVDPTTLSIITQPRRGTVVNHGNGRVTYQSTLNRAGSDAFSYQVLDNDGAISNTATVRVDILRR